MPMNYFLGGLAAVVGLLYLIIAAPETTLAALFIFVGAALYLLPSIVAAVRHHHNTVAIIVLNVFLGWTFLGWLAALVWSATNPAPTGERTSTVCPITCHRVPRGRQLSAAVYSCH
jgi:nicotinamide riboside transporter PnuC